MPDSRPHPNPFEQRLVAEALRHHEETAGLIDDPAAELEAINAGGTFETRLITRALRLAPKAGVAAALDRVRTTARLVALGLGIAGFLAGLTALRGVLAADPAGLVNFYWVLVVLLGLHALALIGWLIVIALRPGSIRATPLRPLLQWGLSFATRRSRQPLLPPALAAWSDVMTQGRIGRWALSLLVHGFWLAVLVGMLLMALILLSARQYDFAWETTILPESWFARTTEVLGRLPARLGFPVPDAELIRESRRSLAVPLLGDQARTAWSGLLIGSLVVYGILPRALLAILSWLALRRARAAFRLDTELPGYARQRPRLMPLAHRLGVVDADTESRHAADGSGDGARPLRIGSGAVAYLGLEIDAPLTGWPPLLGTERHDLGRISDREGFGAALAAIADLQRAPVTLVVVCSLLRTPDRGMARLLARLRETHHGPMTLVFTQEGKLVARLGEAAARQRISDWSALAERTGLHDSTVARLDLDEAETVRHYLAGDPP